MLLAFAASPEEVEVALISLTFGNIEVQRYVYLYIYIYGPNRLVIRHGETEPPNLPNIYSQHTINADFATTAAYEMSSQCYTSSNAKWNGARRKADQKASIHYEPTNPSLQSALNSH